MTNLASRTGQTRARLIKAATEVFANAGLTKATTREIARVAGVNEVTLFRHFQCKEQLLAAVIQQAVALQAESLAHQDEWTQNLYIDLRDYARLCSRVMEEHEALTRTFIGEAKRYPDAARQIVYETDKLLRQQMVAYLQKAQEKDDEQGVAQRVWGAVNPILKSRGFKQGLRVSHTTSSETHFEKDFHT
ncbi:TetR/AcrR family transcriptional regulator [Amazonocrinis nigriterrae]|nr:TetR/AcrR family transcriptional regulator [Amazonocrinis nigriterrae]